MEITGGYDDVVEKLQPAAGERASLGPVMADFSLLLETVLHLDGGTRSAIVDHLPPEMHHTYDAEAIVDALQVLARYDLVVLEGNTWTPGPALTA
ncbi:hypothetical protein [Natronomonas sp.]|uniref:hypothetical protein n=1 Tax=Natronomonas sp. TaxID=2184060 RepID=UPI003988A94E